ncbi:hypothetical protein C4J65_09570 [Streptomyces sp. CB09001]|uniref:hypothetical protein n=1 Tax=unclassified Streptomyces TaxID=2593676 RepID=UPI000E21B094|nr:hypothetical protein [Streptomyces sp. CB09001]AXL88550.1 hypothetical protein C4J65_09570 [Streptomyces sp. CB09001]
MQDAARGVALAFNASAVLRTGGAVFAACPDERLRSLYYRMDAGMRAVWRHLRGADIHPGVVAEAEDANRVLGEQSRELGLPEEFLGSYRDLAATALADFAGREEVSQEDVSALAVEAVGFLEAGVASAQGAVDYERSCQVAIRSLLQGWADDPLSTMRKVRRETGVWALAYQRFVTPVPRGNPDIAD